MTFAAALKYDMFPLAEMLQALLSVGQEGMACPVEMEFSINLSERRDQKPQMAILQIRPMGAREEMMTVDITPRECLNAFCVSHQALGNTINADMADIVYVEPSAFDPANNDSTAIQIAKINASLVKACRKYVLVGPGRWGSADHWLGIPVRWEDICGVGAIVETVHPLINAEPSQGSHFFHNITSLGINYLNVSNNTPDRIDWQWITSLPVINKTANIVHVASNKPFTLKVDGQKSIGVFLSE